MKLFIDPREGSKKLLEKFPDEAEATHLEFGDIMFTGNGPDGDWLIGIEHKQLEDIVGCIKSGRFTGTQLPGMMSVYDICFLLVEGIPKPDPHSGQLVRYRGKSIYGLGISYKAFDNFLTSVSVFSALAGKPCIVKMVGTQLETLHTIRDMYDLFQKPWADHRAMSRPDQSKIQHVNYDLELLKVDPTDPEYPHYLLRKQIFQIQGVGWEVAGVIADRFGTMEKALTATQKEWEDIPRVGKTMAKRAFYGLHGRYDETPTRRKRKDSQ